MAFLHILACILGLAYSAKPLVDRAAASREGAGNCGDPAQHVSLLQTKAWLRSGGARSGEDAPTGFSQSEEHDAFASSYERPGDAPADLDRFFEHEAVAGGYSRQRREAQLLEHAPPASARRAARRGKRRRSQSPEHVPRAHARRAAVQKQKKRELLKQLQELEKQKAQLEQAKTDEVSAGKAKRSEEKRGSKKHHGNKHQKTRSGAKLHGHQDGHDGVKDITTTKAKPSTTKAEHSTIKAKHSTIKAKHNTSSANLKSTKVQSNATEVDASKTKATKHNMDVGVAELIKSKHSGRHIKEQGHKSKKVGVHAVESSERKANSTRTKVHGSKRKHKFSHQVGKAGDHTAGSIFESESNSTRTKGERSKTEQKHGHKSKQVGNVTFGHTTQLKANSTKTKGKRSRSEHGQTSGNVDDLTVSGKLKANSTKATGNGSKTQHSHTSGEVDDLVGSSGELKANSTRTRGKTRKTGKERTQHASIKRRHEIKGKNSSGAVRHIPIGQQPVLEEQEVDRQDVNGTRKADRHDVNGSRKADRHDVNGTRKAHNRTVSAKHRDRTAPGRRNSSSIKPASSTVEEPELASNSSHVPHKHHHFPKKSAAGEEGGHSTITAEEDPSPSSWARKLDLAVLGSLFKDGEESTSQESGPNEAQLASVDPSATLYVMGKVDSDACPEGYAAIDTGAEALSAARSLGADLNANFVVNDRNNMPIGCFKDPTGMFYFNTRTEETTVPLQGTPVCKIQPRVSLSTSSVLSDEALAGQLHSAGLNVTGDYYLIAAGDRYLTSKDGPAAITWTAGSLAELGPEPKTLRWRITAVPGGKGTYILGNLGRRGFLAALDGRIGVVPPPEMQSSAEPLAWRLEQLPGTGNMFYIRGKAGAGEYLVTQTDGLAIPWGGVAASQAATPPENARWRLVKADTIGDGSDGTCIAYMATSGCGWTSNWSCPGQSLGAQGAAQFMGGIDPQGYHCCCELQHYADEMPESSLWSFPDAPVSPTRRSEELADGHAGATVDLGFAQDHVGEVHNMSVLESTGDATNKTGQAKGGDVDTLMRRVEDLEGLKSGDDDEKSKVVHEGNGDDIDALMKRVADLEAATRSASSAHRGHKKHNISKTSKQVVKTGSKRLREEDENTMEKKTMKKEEATKGLPVKKDGKIVDSLPSVSQQLDSMRDAFELSIDSLQSAGA